MIFIFNFQGLGLAKNDKSNALAVKLDAEGKVRYDVIAKQGHSKDRVSSYQLIEIGYN